MKKGLLLMIFLVVSCSSLRYEELVKDYVTDYYNDYIVKNEGVTSYEITIEMLDRVYKLEKLDNCKKASYVVITVNGDEITNYEYHLNCK